MTLTGNEAQKVYQNILSTYGPVISLPPDSPIIQAMFSIYTETVAEGIRDPYQASVQSYQFLMTCQRFFCRG